VEVFAGLNVLIILFKLHAAAQPHSYPNLPADAPPPAISFHPCSTPQTEAFDRNQLLKIIYFADALGWGTFASSVGPHLFRANLLHANLYSANLRRVNLSSADLHNVNLSYACLYGTDLSNADLSNADLYGTDLSNANLSSANLYGIDLSNAYLYSANLSSAYLSNADLYSANLSSAILLNTNLHSVNRLSQQQLEGDSPPLICNTALPSDIQIAKDRDCDRLPAVLIECYPSVFETLESAEAFVRQHQQEKA